MAVPRVLVNSVLVCADLYVMAACVLINYCVYWSMTPEYWCVVYWSLFYDFYVVINAPVCIDQLRRVYWLIRRVLIIDTLSINNATCIDLPCINSCGCLYWSKAMRLLIHWSVLLHVYALINAAVYWLMHILICNVLISTDLFIDKYWWVYWLAVNWSVPINLLINAAVCIDLAIKRRFNQSNLYSICRQSSIQSFPIHDSPIHVSCSGPSHWFL